MRLSHVAKYRSLMPSLALIGHLIDGVAGGPTGPVSGGAAARAVAWCEYLQGHARRLYAECHRQGAGGGRRSFASQSWGGCARTRSGPPPVGAPPCGSGPTRGSWRAGMTDRATFLRRLSDAPDVAPVANSPTEVLGFVGYALVPHALRRAQRAPVQEFERSAELSGSRGSPTRSP